MAISKSKNNRLTREDLIKSPEFWIENIRTELFNMVNDYMDNNHMSRKELADKLGVSKGYISQLLNGDSDHRISSLAALATNLGMAPYLYLKDMEKVLEADKIGAGIFLDFTEMETKAERCDMLERISSNAMEKTMGKYFNAVNIISTEIDYLNYFGNTFSTEIETEYIQEPIIDLKSNKNSLNSGTPKLSLADAA